MKIRGIAVGIFKDILKDIFQPGWDDVEECPIQKAEPEIRIKVVGDDDGEPYEDFMANLKEKRKEESRPKIARVDARDKFYSYKGTEFDWSDVAIAKSNSGTRYLLDGSNADKVFDDIVALNEFADQAESIADVPNFRIPIADILLAPEWMEKGYENKWLFSYILPEPLTKTGKLPKYPVYVQLVSRSESYEARLKYNQKDKIGSAEIRVGDLGRSSHTLTVRDGKIIRIMKHEGFENFPVYSAE